MTAKNNGQIGQKEQSNSFVLSRRKALQTLGAAGTIGVGTLASADAVRAHHSRDGQEVMTIRTTEEDMMGGRKLDLCTTVEQIDSADLDNETLYKFGISSCASSTVADDDDVSDGWIYESGYHIDGTHSNVNDVFVKESDNGEGWIGGYGEDQTDNYDRSWAESGVSTAKSTIVSNLLPSPADIVAGMVMDYSGAVEEGAQQEVNIEWEFTVPARGDYFHEASWSAQFRVGVTKGNIGQIYITDRVMSQGSGGDWYTAEHTDSFSVWGHDGD